MRMLHVRSASLLLLIGLSRATVGLAMPPLPMHALGTVEVDAGNVPNDTEVSAVCDGEIYGITTTYLISGQSHYDLLIQGDDPETPEREGCLSGDSVSFVITLGDLDLIANETATWVAGGVANINLTADSPMSVSSLPRPTSVLHQNSPNPFNPQTAIAFELPWQVTVSLRVYDISGHLVDVLLDDEVAAQGRNEVLWGGRDQTGRLVPSGTYFYRLTAGGYTETKRMVLLK